MSKIFFFPVINTLITHNSEGKGKILGRHGQYGVLSVNL